MTMKWDTPIEWWRNEGNKIGTLESEETGVTSLYAIQQEGEWVYAITFWYRGCATLLRILKGGKAEKE